jgi:hypothetical protein
MMRPKKSNDAVDVDSIAGMCMATGQLRVAETQGDYPTPEGAGQV